LGWGPFESGPEKVSVRDALGPGTRLLEFEVLRVLGTGGFGIVYLARDHVLQRDIAIKEYMPATLARRGDGAAVVLRGGTAGLAQTFAKGLESFLGEARLLASFDHPALVKVHRFWRGNDTAYMAMPYYPGRTLKDVRLEMPAAPSVAWLKGLIEPVLGALEQLHAHGVCHRDIAPDNILVLPDGRPVLLDFGCARRAVAGGSQWFTAHLKPQFAPLEQYADEGSVGQGSWTDLYSLGATLYFVVTGRAPAASVARAACDTLPPRRCNYRLRPACSAPSTDPRPRARPSAGRRDGSTRFAAIAPPPPRRMPIDAGDPRGGDRCAGRHGGEARSVAGRSCAGRGGASGAARTGAQRCDCVRRLVALGWAPRAPTEPSEPTRWPRSVRRPTRGQERRVVSQDWRTPCCEGRRPRSPMRLGAGGRTRGDPAGPSRRPPRS
jgi:serine/threonine protein kinase